MGLDLAQSMTSPAGLLESQLSTTKLQPKTNDEEFFEDLFNNIEMLSPVKLQKGKSLRGATMSYADRRRFERRTSKVSSKSKSNKKLGRLGRRGTLDDGYFDQDSAQYFKEYFGQDDARSSLESRGEGEGSTKKSYKKTLDPKRRGSMFALSKQHSESSALLKGSPQFKSPARSRRRNTIVPPLRILNKDESVR